jgi:hypothetical protein
MELGRTSTRLQRFLLSILQNKSQQLYINALNHFKDELVQRDAHWASFNDEEKDIFLAEYVIDVKEAGGRRQACQILCAALHKINPRDHFLITRKVLDTWKAEEPIRQAPACPAEVAFALVASSLAISQPGLAAAILLCFTGLLRCSEALALRWTDMIFTDNVVVLLLGQTKRGIDQKVVLSHPATCRWLLQYTLQFRRHMSDKVCPLSYSKMRYWLPKLCHSLKLDGLLLTSHSFRRGGASCLLHQGVALADIAVQGRWASESSCREYLRRGEMFVLRYQAAVKQEVWDNILLLAKSLFVLLPQCDSS